MGTETIFVCRIGQEVVMDEVKPWRCENGHILGQVFRDSNGIRKMLLYRDAIDELGEMAQVDVMAVVEGHVLDVRCSICGAFRTWVPGEESLRQLIERMKH